MVKIEAKVYSEIVSKRVSYQAHTNLIRILTQEIQIWSNWRRLQLA